MQKSRSSFMQNVQLASKYVMYFVFIASSLNYLHYRLLRRDLEDKEGKDEAIFRTIMQNQNKMEFISIGPKCITAMNLKQTGYRRAAYPFDWIFCSLSMVQHCIETNFVYFLDRTRIVRVSPNVSDHTFYNEFIQVGDERRVPIFNHHDLTDEIQYQTISKRCARFLRRFNDKSHTLCLVYTIQIDNKTAIWSLDDDPEWKDACRFATFLKEDQRAEHIMLLTFILRRTDGGAPPKEQVHDGDNHKAFTVFYDEYDNLRDVADIMEIYCK